MNNNNIFKTTSLEVGDSATLVINDIREGKFGPVYIGTVDGQAAEIRPSGNLKFVLEKAEFGKAMTVTRKADEKTKAGFSVTKFDVGAPGAAAAPNTVADKLAAIRAKRAQPTSNS